MCFVYKSQNKQQFISVQSPNRVLILETFVYVRQELTQFTYGNFVVQMLKIFSVYFSKLLLLSYSKFHSLCDLEYT
jgi:hypothetical protein